VAFLGLHVAPPQVRAIRHSGTIGTGPYDMDAAFMQFKRHERGIHAVRTGGGPNRGPGSRLCA
jgi:hypothetical protein